MQRDVSGWWVCEVCGYIYDPARHGGVPFERLSPDWICPGCGFPRSAFVKYAGLPRGKLPRRRRRGGGFGDSAAGLQGAVGETRNLTMRKWKCDACSYVYDPALGDPDNGVAPGTKFEDVPADWLCPECGVGKDSFTLLEE